jgi:mRNA-degrading endonuclease RelE of RelBE toxin-antitoxin system
VAELVELVTVVETPAFTKQAAKVWSEEERGAFIYFIAANPDAGDVIPETGGVRKVRWSIQKSGKRGGARVIYFFYNRTAPIYLLMVYSKRTQENISPEARKILREFAAAFKRELRRSKQ